MLQYDQPTVVNDLSELPKEGRIAVAAAAVTRLFPRYEAFCLRTGWGDSVAVRAAISHAWANAQGQPHRSEETNRIKKAIDRLAAAEPREGFGRDYNFAYFETLAVGKCLDAQITGNPASAAKALKLVFDAAYNYGLTELLKGKGPTIMTDEIDRQIYSHSIVQTELRRQERDRSEIRSVTPDHLMSAINRLYKRAKEEPTLPQVGSSRSRKRKT
jgi:hypothetical protein